MTGPSLVPRWRRRDGLSWHALRRGFEADRMLCGRIVVDPVEQSKGWPHDHRPKCQRCVRAWDLLGRPR